jgi:D-serine deaminase-like pyridoxal phosphate-dependent protein
VFDPLDIEKPTLLLNRRRAMANIERMAHKARASGVTFRPHFKTHQSAQIGEWFGDFGAEAITVSSLDMAAYFAAHGWRDITVAFPANIREIDTINDLAESVDLGLLVESTETVSLLRQHLTSPAGVWIKIDVGQHRTGIGWDQLDRVLQVARQTDDAELLELRGVLTHSGHSYGARSHKEIEEVYRETVQRMRHVADALRSAGLRNVLISVGDTPTCTVVDDLSEVDEVRPGNFVFYDVMQLDLGVCSEDDVAVAVACPVVAKHEERKELIVYGGAVHLSVESIKRADGTPVFGYVALPSEDGWGPVLPDAYVSSLSQEHGIVRLRDEEFGGLRVGDLLMLLPVHSCLTVNLLKEYQTLDGETIAAMGAT